MLVMNPLSIVGAIVAGIIGALIWGAISFFTGYEIGYVAWGIGFLVGMGVVVTGGGSPMAGIMSAVVALVAILGGKALAVKFEIDKSINEVATQSFSEYEQSAAKYAALEEGASYAQFLVDEEWTDAKKAEDVPAGEVEDFELVWVPFLEAITDGSVTSENWLQKSEPGKGFKAATSELVSIPGAVKEGLGLFDLLFGFLGIATAYRVGCGGSKDE